MLKIKIKDKIDQAPHRIRFELRVPEVIVGRSSLYYLHRRVIQRSTVQFVMIIWCAQVTRE